MRKTKKTICAVLAIFVFAFSFNVSAVAVTNETDYQLIKAINDLEFVRDEYGLTNVNFEKFEIASPIHTYQYTAAGFIESYEYYPLLIDNFLTLLAIKIANADNYLYQLTTSLVAEINRLVSLATRFALIYGCDGCYLYNGQNFIQMTQFNEEEGGRLSVSEISVLPSTANIELANMDNHVSVGYSNSLSYNARVPIYYSCNVSVVFQTSEGSTRTNENICWAACTACIYNYKFGANITAESVARDYWDSYSDFDRTLDSTQIHLVLLAYGLPYAFKSHAPGDGVILANIRADNPLIGGFFSNSGTNGHLCVIYGINISSSYLYIMNPNSGFQTATYTAGEGHSYVSTITGAKMILRTGFAVSWSA